MNFGLLTIRNSKGRLPTSSTSIMNTEKLIRNEVSVFQHSYTDSVTVYCQESATYIFLFYCYCKIRESFDHLLVYQGRRQVTDIRYRFSGMGVIVTHYISLTQSP